MSGQIRNEVTGWHPIISHCKLFAGFWGDRDLSQLGHVEIEEWIAARRSQVKDSTIIHQISVLNQAFVWAVEEGHADRNPLQRVKVRLRRQPRSRRLSHAEEAALRAAYDTDELGGALEWSAVRFAILTGCRRMEQLQLRPESVQVVSEQDEDYLLQILDGKSGPRTIPLHPEAYQIARVWMSIPSNPPSPWIFWPQEHTKRFDFGLWHYNKIFTPMVRRAGLRDFHWHDLRRTFACRLVERGVPIFEIQTLLGHQDPKITLTYCCVDASQLRGSVAKIK